MNELFEKFGRNSPGH